MKKINNKQIKKRYVGRRARLDRPIHIEYWNENRNRKRSYLTRATGGGIGRWKIRKSNLIYGHILGEESVPRV